jgi:hypothetical protein
MRRSEIDGISARASFDHLGEDLLERIPDHAPDLRSVVYDERGVGLSDHRPLPEAGPAIKMKPPIHTRKKGTPPPAYSCYRKRREFRVNVRAFGVKISLRGVRHTIDVIISHSSGRTG